MKRIAFILLGFTLLFSANAQQIDVQTAQKVAECFYAQHQTQKSAAGLKLYSTAPMKNMQKSAGNANYYYIFNDGNSGFVIVSGDQRCTPVLGYSTSGSFDTTDMPDNLRWWMRSYCDEMDSAFLQADADSMPIQAEWTEMINGNFHVQKSTTAVQPLIKTKWGQGPPYNDYCPYDVKAGADQNYRCVTGCVATAMAQILYYWKYPQKGTGYHSYQRPNYGTLSANFGNTTYDWNNMTTTYDSYSSSAEKKAVATLMYHCGVSVDMQYTENESGAYTILPDKYISSGYMDARTALKRYFDCDTTMGYTRSSYLFVSNWISLLKNELDAGRPILYSGSGTEGGHAFVCDGYDNNNYFHFNWGWNGSYDSYYSISALNPGSRNYSDEQDAIFVWPKQNSSNYDLRLYGNIWISSNPVTYNTAFWLSDSIANYSSTDFKGYIGIAFYKQDGTYLGVAGKTALNLASMRYYPDFKCNIPAQAGLTNGTYIVRFVYTTDGDSYWHLLGDGNYNNKGAFTVSGGAATYNLELYSNIHISQNPVQYNTAFYFTDSILNSGSITYNGTVGVAIYKWDGTFVNIFGKSPLNLGSYYMCRDFKCDIPAQNNLEAGSYYARYVYLNNEDNYWYYIDNGSYNNYLSFQITGGNTQKRHTLYVFSDNATAGSVSGGCSFYNDTTVTIRATANSGYRFTRWNDGNTNSSRVVTVKSDTTFIAYFEASAAKMYKITVLSIDTNMGTVRGEGTFKENSQTTIMATAKKGYQFVQWQDGNNQRIRTITVIEDATYTAFFDVADGIGDIERDGIRVFSTDNVIVVRNAENHPLRICNTLGQIMYSEENVSSSELRISMPAAGVYYVMVGDGTVKKCVVGK
ncbi:MAG: C10 family peptidase [Bacteroidales bacterium]|nr:C10 family peptidase [Bacteroidales bacterium]